MILDRKLKRGNSLEAASHQAVAEDREYKEGHHNVEPVTFNSESHNREGNSNHRGGDQEEEPELDQTLSPEGQDISPNSRHGP